LESPRAERSIKTIDVTLLESCPGITQKVLQLYSISDKWQNYMIFMHFQSGFYLFICF